MADEEENAPIEIKEKLIDIIIAMRHVGFTNFSIGDIIYRDIDMNKINSVSEKFGLIDRESYDFIYDLFRKYRGRTLLDVLENMYGEDALKIVKEEEKEIDNLIKIIDNPFMLEIKLLSIQNLGNKIKLKVASKREKNKIYEFEIEKDRLEGQNLEAGKEYNKKFITFDKSKGKFVLEFELTEEEKDKEYKTIKVKSLSDLLGIIGKNTFKIVLVVSELEDKKLELKFMELESQKHYALEIDEDRVVCEDYYEDYYIANIKFDEKKGKYILYLTLLNEDEEDEEIEPFEIDKTSSIEENFERFVEYVVDVLNKRLEKEPEKIHYFTSVNYLKPFVEDFVNKIQTDWIYANLDRKLALKSFALYLAEQKGLNIERFKYLKEQYINIDIMLGTIILKQKILDKYANNYL